MSTTLTPLVDEQPIVEREPGASRVVGETPFSLFTYLVLGTFFGILLTRAELVSWYRIQEMFRFQSFHMYGTLGSAVLVGAVSLQILRRRATRTAQGVPIMVPPKERTPGLRRYWLGGTVFGLGWALLGACPGPIFALIGTGLSVMIVALAAALLGTLVYAWLRPVLPH